MTELGMRGLDSCANAELVEMSLLFRALPPNQTTGPNALGRWMLRGGLSRRTSLGFRILVDLVSGNPREIPE